MRHLIARIIQHEGAPVRLIEHDHEVRVDRVIGLQDDVPLNSGGGGTDFAVPFAHIERGGPLPTALIVISDLLGPHADDAPDFPVLWVAEEEYDAVAPFGHIVPWGAAACLDLPATARTLQPAVDRHNGMFGYLPESPVFTDQAPAAGVVTGTDRVAEALAPGMDAQAASVFYEELTESFLDFVDTGHAFGRAASRGNTLATFDALRMRGFAVPEPVVTALTQAAARHAEAVPMYLRLPSEKRSPAAAIRLFYKHSKHPHTLELILSHPDTPLELATRAAAELHRMDRNVRHPVARALACHPEARCLDLVQEAVIEHGDADAVRWVSAHLNPDRFLKACRRLWQAEPNATSLLRVMDRSSAAQRAALTDLDWAGLLAHPDSEVRLRVLGLRGRTESEDGLSFAAPKTPIRGMTR